MSNPFSFPTHTDATGSVDPANVVPGTLTDVNLAGTYSLSGTPSLGADVDANGNTITDLGAPTPASAEAATATYAETVASTAATTAAAAVAARLGCQIVIATLPFTGAWTAGDWAGPVSAATGPQGGSGTISAVINHGPGTLSDFRLQARNTAPSNLNVTVYKSAGGSPSYSATAAIIKVLSGEQAGSYANGISVADNDQLIVTTDTDWSGSGMTVTAWYTPT